MAFKMKGLSPFHQEEEKLGTRMKTPGDDVLKKRFGTGWEKARDAGWTVINGEVIPPPTPSKDEN
jgi:hypothetical protein